MNMTRKTITFTAAELEALTVAIDDRIEVVEADGDEDGQIELLLSVCDKVTRARQGVSDD